MCVQFRGGGRGGVLNTMGVFSIKGDTMSTIGDIFSPGRISSVPWGYLQYWGISSVPWGILSVPGNILSTMGDVQYPGEIS